MRRLIPNSLYGQLFLAQLLLFGLITILLPTVLLIELRRTVDDFVAERLRDDAQIIAAQLARPGRPSQPRLNQALGSLYRPDGATRAYRVTDDAGRILLQGGAVQGWSAAAVPDGKARSFSRSGNLDILRESRTIGGTSYHIAVAQDRAGPQIIVDDVVANFLPRTIWLAPLLFLGSTLLSLFVLRRLTATLRHVAREAERIGPQTLDTRLDADRLPREARSLAAATNHALDRVEQGYRRQQSFVESVAHELRTPLALVALRCDLFPPGPEKDALKRAVNQATHVVSQLMDLAVVEGRASGIAPVDLDRIARETVEASAPLVYRSGRTIEVMSRREPVCRVFGNDGLLRIALTNLIDNAVRHTPVATHIVVAAGPDAILVRDNGPGIELEGGDAIIAHYRTAARQRTDSAGLGLAIVQRIMTAMGGSMVVMPTGPGTSIRLKLSGEPEPAPPPRPSAH